jgi:glycerophosphoryl diester phosphodiesterase
MVKSDLRSRKEMTRPLIIGHRGASAHAPENTLAAFRLAIELGADGVEFDVQLSKDGVPVVIHDYDLNRTSVCDERVSDLTSKQLCKIDVGSWFNSKNPSLAKPDFSYETVPTLSDVLKLLEASSGPIYIELKCDETNIKPLVAAVCEVIGDSPMLPRMIVKSFRLSAIPEVRYRLPNIQTAALFEPSILTILRSRKFIVGIAREFGAHQISLHYSLITPRICGLAEAAKMPITIWTVDDAKWLTRSSKLGIGALITNDPAMLIAERN